MPTPLPNGVYRVTDQLTAGPFPHSSVTSLVEAGVSTFVDLTGHGSSYDRLLPPGTRRVSFPVPDFSIPTAGEMSKILDHIDARLEDGVYVHCGAGIGRTGTVVGCWLIRHGLATSLDWREVLADLRGPGATPSPETTAQRAFVSGWLPGR